MVQSYKWCPPVIHFWSPIIYNNLYINDLSENINCNIKQYADDTKLYTTVKEDKDVLEFQYDLDHVAQWSKE